jgi:hypothetical protein
MREQERETRESASGRWNESPSRPIRTPLRELLEAYSQPYSMIGSELLILAGARCAKS